MEEEEGLGGRGCRAVRGEDGEVREGLQEPSWCVESPSLPRGRGKGEVWEPNHGPLLLETVY